MLSSNATIFLRNISLGFSGHYLLYLLRSLWTESMIIISIFPCKFSVNSRASKCLLDRWMDERMNRWMDGGRDKRKDGWI